MKRLGIIITAASGIILVGLAIFLGNRYHNKHTPSIVGQIQGEVHLEKDDITAMDEYSASIDKTVALQRSFYYDGDLVIIEVPGEWKEKTKYYKLTFQNRSAHYSSENKPLNSKGRTISPKHFLDKTVRIPKAGISAEGMNILLKREKKEWKSFKLHWKK